MNLERKTKFFLYDKFPKMDAIHWMALPVRRELFQKWLWSIIVETDIMSHRHNANDNYKYDLMSRTSTSATGNFFSGGRKLLTTMETSLF
jgi:hypothetical protein